MVKVKELFPFIISLIGIIMDYLTSVVGLSLGFVERHPNYSPINALIIFWGSITLLKKTLPKGRFWQLSIDIISLAPYLGMINNLLVILPYVLSM